MHPQRVAELLGQDPERLGAADAVFYGDPEAAQAPFVDRLFLGQLATLRLLVGYIQVRMLLVIALVAAVGVATRLGWQGWSGTSDAQVMVGTRM